MADYTLLKIMSEDPDGIYGDWYAKYREENSESKVDANERNII